MLSILAIPLLYVATWPPIDIKNTTIIHAYGPSLAVPHETIISRPAWVTTVYRPLHALMDMNGGHNPIAAYWQWWLRRLS